MYSNKSFVSFALLLSSSKILLNYITRKKLYKRFYRFLKEFYKDDINNLKDGVRDQYLSETYTGTNWYSKYKDIKLNKTKKNRIHSV